MNRGSVLAVGSAALILLMAPVQAQAQKRSCITDQEIESVLGPQVRSGAPLIDASRIDDGRPLCTGGTIARRIHRMREEAFPNERSARLAREDVVRADIARLAAQQEADLDAAHDLELLQQAARSAEARRDAAEAQRDEAQARAMKSEAELRDARARRKLAALPSAAIPVKDARVISDQLEALVQHDSEYWLTRSYRVGSMRNTRLNSLDWTSQVYDIEGDFSYDNGATGHVRVHYTNGAFACIQFSRTTGIVATSETRSRASWSRCSAISSWWQWLAACKRCE